MEQSTSHTPTTTMTTSPQTSPLAPPSLPLAVHVGFSGARRLWPAGSTADPVAEQVVAALLREALAELPTALGLSSQHFVVGVSQIAVGADMLFTEALAALGWGQRIFLPERRDDYLNAVGSEGDDFTPEQRERARRYLGSSHLIEERVVSTAESRSDRFDDTNLQILTEADVLVCLRREDQASRPGGTLQMMERAKARGLVVLELRLSWIDGAKPHIEKQWHFDACPRFLAPALPPVAQQPTTVLALQTSLWPDPQDYATALKDQASARAKGRRSGFRWSAGMIVGTHLVATLIASLVLGHLIFDTVAKIALFVEIALLIWGFLIHRQLHKGRHTEDWAMARLCAEVCRSTRAFGRMHGSLGYLLAMPFPQELKPVLRTLEVLHLRSMRAAPVGDWRTELERYVEKRLTSPNRLQGQIAYYGHEQAKAQALAARASRFFMLMSFAAIAVTTIKLSMKLLGVDLGQQVEWFGVAAVVFPVGAVGVMSMAAALDAEAREHIFAQMRDFLITQSCRLKEAASHREAAALAIETETRLLGESVTWYSRRAYTGIA